MVKTTSSEVNGLPSLHSVPGRSLTIHSSGWRWLHSSRQPTLDLAGFITQHEERFHHVGSCPRIKVPGMADSRCLEPDIDTAGENKNILARATVPSAGAAAAGAEAVG